MKMNTLDWVALALVLVGALNWGLVGLANFNLVMTLFGNWPTVARVIYLLVGLSALYVLYMSMNKKG